MTTNTKDKNIEEYRRHLNKLIETYAGTYPLPQLSGADKQISWATDLRIKFIDKIDKQKLTDTERNAVIQYLQEKTESRYWIDNKSMTWQEHLIHAKQNAGSSTPEPQQTPGVIVIDTRAADISISAPDDEKVTELLARKGFARSGPVWIKNVPKSDTGRTTFVESLCLALLSSGYATRILAEEPKEPRHEGRLCVENGRLCLETSAQHIWKAAATIGTRKIWMDGAEPAAVQNLLNTYDIICTNDAKQQLDRTSS